MQHPSNFIPADVSENIRSLAAESERSGELHPGILQNIYCHRWFHLFVPESFGGLELTLTEALRLEEGLAWADGSVGWTVTLCSGAAWFIGFLEPSATQEIFRHPQACLAGSGQASGTAEVREDGYRVTGHWKYATGTPQATVFTANCVLHKDGQELRDGNGAPLVHAFWFHRHEVKVHPAWHSMGMIATASHSFEVSGLTLPFNRCFSIDPAKAVLPHIIFQYPFLPFAETTLAVNSAGMAIRFMDLCRSSRVLDKTISRMEQERESFYRVVEDSWSELLRNGTLSHQTGVAVGLVSRQLATLSLRLVDELYPLCGMEAADTRTEINRVWRNLHTASQHALLRAPAA